MTTYCTAKELQKDLHADTELKATLVSTNEKHALNTSLCTL